MSAVIDASVVVAALTDSGADGRWAESIIEAGDLVAPQLMHAEAANICAVWKKARVLGHVEAAAAYRELTRLDVEPVSFAPFAERIWELPASVTSYDAW